MYSLAPLPRTPNSVLSGAIAETTEQLLSRRDELPAGDPRRAALRDRAVEANLPMARRLARRYAGRGELLDDLAQVAALALVRAVDGFDSRRGIPFAGYAIPSILGALKRNFRDAGWAMRMSRSTQEMVVQVRRVTAELSQRNGRPPTSGEVATSLRVGPESVRGAELAAQSYRLDSLDTLRARSGDDPGSSLDTILGQVDPQYQQVENRLAMRAMIAAMPARDRRILTMRFYDDMTQATIAVAEGVSQMHISRLLKQALTNLRMSIASDVAPLPAARQVTAVRRLAAA